MKRRSISWVVVGCILLLFLARAVYSPVIVAIKNPSAVDPGDGLYVWLSPLRSRAPERRAAMLLDELRNGRCDNEQIDCAEESKYSLIAWKLVNRKDASDGFVVLQYKVFRKSYAPDAWGNTWITLAKSGKTWKVVRYESWY